MFHVLTKLGDRHRVVPFLTSLSGADEPTKKEPSREELIKKLEADLTNVKLIGRFTVAGREDREPKPEEYTITSTMKLPEADMWLIKARIKYGDKDTTVPMPLEIKWAGDTPVITLDRPGDSESGHLHRPRRDL